MLKSLRLAVAPLAMAAAMTPLTAFAAGSGVSVSHATLYARIDVRLNLKINCPTPAAGDSVEIDEVDATVEQAAGTGIASGNGGAVAVAPGPLLFQCTSTNVAFPVDVLASVSGRPFHKGNAIVTALLDITYASGAEFDATYGPAVVRLTG